MLHEALLVFQSCWVSLLRVLCIVLKSQLLFYRGFYLPKMKAKLASEMLATWQQHFSVFSEFSKDTS